MQNQISPELAELEKLLDVPAAPLYAGRLVLRTRFSAEALSPAFLEMADLTCSLSAGVVKVEVSADPDSNLSYLDFTAEANDGHNALANVMRGVFESVSMTEDELDPYQLDLVAGHVVSVEELEYHRSQQDEAYEEASEGLDAGSLRYLEDDALIIFDDLRREASGLS